jgi:1-acyl-sn-glycerol-3-phosphate acyltransferase
MGRIFVGNNKVNFYCFARFISKILLRFLGKIEINGIDNIPQKGPFIIVADHSSYLDGFVMISVFKHELTFFSAAYLFDNPFIGFFLRKIKAIPVSTDKKRISFRKTLKEAISRLENGKVLMIFPEGGLRSSDRIDEIKSGAAYISVKNKVPVLPVAIKGTREILPSGSYFPRRGKVAINIGTIISPVHDDIQKDAINNMTVLIRDSINELRSSDVL